MAKRWPIPLLLLLISFPAFAFQYDFGLMVSERIYSVNNFWDQAEGNNNQDDVYNLLLIYPWIDIEITEGLNAYCESNTALYWGRETDENNFDEDTELFEGFLQWKVSFIPGLTLKGGKIGFISGAGYILDKNSPGMLFRYDLELSYDRPVTFGCFWSRIEEESYIFHFQFDYRIAFFEKLGLFWAYFHDGDNGLGEILNRKFPVGYYFESSGNWHYAGVEVEKFLGRLLLQIEYIYQFGSMDMEVSRWVWRGEKDIHISAHLLDVNLLIPLGEEMSAKFFYLFATGDDVSSRDSNGSLNLNAFFGVSPFIKKTNIFFNGGVDDTFTSDTISLVGPGIAGLSVPGVTLSYYFSDRLDIENTWALLMTHTESENRGRHYGWETDIIFNLRFTENLSLFVEVDYLDLGDYFKDVDNNSIRKGVVGINFSF